MPCKYLSHQATTHLAPPCYLALNNLSCTSQVAPTLCLQTKINPIKQPPMHFLCLSWPLNTPTMIPSTSGHVRAITTFVTPSLTYTSSPPPPCTLTPLTKHNASYTTNASPLPPLSRALIKLCHHVLRCTKRVRQWLSPPPLHLRRAYLHLHCTFITAPFPNQRTSITITIWFPPCTLASPPPCHHRELRSSPLVAPPPPPRFRPPPWRFSEALRR